MVKTKIGVIGAGAWGTALAIHLAKLHNEINIWGRNSDSLKSIIDSRQNQRYLPNIELPNNIVASYELASLIQQSTHLVVAVPSTTMRSMMQEINQHASDNLQGVIWACKGLEQASGKFLHQVAKEELADTISNAILSGPSFAQEVGQGLPTAVTIASNDLPFANQVAQLFHHTLFRAYVSDDMTGVEIGGAFKNILAIAAGIIDGLAFGANARAALITRGIAEMMRFGKHQHANMETFTGLSGIGDIVLTCTENLSRNRRFGLGIGQGKSVNEIEAEINQVIEGKYATEVVYNLAHTLNIDLPITTQVYEVLYNNKPARSAVEDLLSRSLKHETD